MGETSAFLGALYSAMPEGSKILIWTLQDKRSVWASSIEDAEKAVENAKQRCDTYFGIGLSGKDYGGARRCKANDIIGIPGVWADFDIAHAGAHQKPNLPPNRQAILDMIAEVGLAPTITVNSGHGLQCYWAFHDLWLFASEQERQDGERLVRAWNDTLRYIAARHHWDVDSTFDLARVYRVPGTTNRKVPSEQVPVYLVEIEESRRYTRQEIESKLIAKASEQRQPKEHCSVSITDNLTLDPEAKVDMDLFECLKEIEPKFGLSWDRKRKDMQDQSGSAYDLSLSTYAAHAGWSDQEIVNLLIAHRRKHKDALKLRQDYYRLTLFKARQSLARDQAAVALEELLHTDAETFAASAPTVEVEEPDEEAYEDPFEEDEGASPTDTPPNEGGSPPQEPRQRPKKRQEPPAPTSADEMKRQKILEHVSDLLGIKVNNLIKYVSSDPTFRLETDRGGIMLGGVGGLIRQEALRMQVAALTGHYMPKFKERLWEQIAQSLLNACEEQSAGEEATDEGEIRAWLRIYLSEQIPARSGITHDVVINQTPYIDEETSQVYIFALGMQDWLKKKYGQNITSKRLCWLLRLHDAHPETAACKVNGKSTTRSVWRLPDGDYDGGA